MKEFVQNDDINSAFWEKRMIVLWLFRAMSYTNGLSEVGT